MTTQPPAQPLDPCPFCGRRPTLTVRPDNAAATAYFAAVACFCGGFAACARKDATAIDPAEAEAKARAAWNRRASLAKEPASQALGDKAPIGEEGWTACAQIGPPGSCYMAQVFDPEGNCALTVEPSGDPAIATRVAQICAMALDAHAALSAHSAPEGWQLVPKEATQQMCAAAVIYANGNAVYKNVAADALKIEEAIYGEAYAAMLEAAPTPPKGQGEKP